jgi:glycerol-3-phosphate dehydrogenase
VSDLELSRASHLSRLVSTPVDVLVIGGGITGAGIALDAATRGYTVGLVEQADFAGGTSSRSTKLIHGGIRYLANGQFQLVREALRERTTLLHLAPWVVQPQPFLIPLYAHLHRPLGLRVPHALRSLAPVAIGIGLWGYDQFAGDRSLPHRRVDIGEVDRYVPSLVKDGLQTAYLYYDARTDDVRLTHAVLRTARQRGALTVNYARACAFRYERDRIRGVQIEDRLSGQTHEITARHVVNATGVWAERVAEMDRPISFRIKPSKGIHVVLRKGVANWQSALVIPETDDGRLLFVTPWWGHMIIGTTDDPFAGSLEDPQATDMDVTYLLDHVNRYLKTPIVPTDLVGLFAGLRPLIVSRDTTSKNLSREHQVVNSSSGLISIIGGKLTSYRKMAEDTVNEVARQRGERRASTTVSTPLDGTVGWEDARKALSASGLPAEQQDHLVASYGARAREVLEIAHATPEHRVPLIADEPVLAAEVIYACRSEMCVTLADFMVTRSHLSVVAGEAATPAGERVGTLMATELGWGTAEVDRQRRTWEEAVANQRSILDQIRRTPPHPRPPLSAGPADSSTSPISY